MQFGDILRGLLEQDGISQKQLADALNLAPSTLGNYIRGLREPDFATLSRVADFFGVTADFLLGRRPPEGLSHEEEELVRLYRALSSQGRKLLRSIGELLSRQEGGAEKALKKRCGSIPLPQRFFIPAYFSKWAATSFKYSMTGRCCGQTDSHWPQAMQSLALPKMVVRFS